MRQEEIDQIPGFRNVPRTGVIYVMHRAREQGYTAEHPQWANLGQGAPETGPLEGSPPRIEQISINPASHEYSPITGQTDLRQKVADMYNWLYRQNKASKYTWENVSISGGGRVALTRIAAALGTINMGHFLPDYTAYEELLSVFKAFIPIPILLDADLGYKPPLEQIRREVLGRGLKALLISNPCNPTGQLIEGQQLSDWVSMSREYACSLILDEFYSHYIYTGPAEGFPKMVSAAQYVEDVNEDPVIIVDGLTKNWRYPGWRISWTVGPKQVINPIASAGSFLDGGPNHPFQEHVGELLEPEVVIQETVALQKTFRRKRDYVLSRLQQMGVLVDAAPEGTFYVWANLSQLPAPINEGLSFFKKGLAYNFITVPGIFFDVNPDKRRDFGRYKHYARISFGPEMEVLERGMNAMAQMIKDHQP
ncbi:MAG: pyridoxal phosphate-dependent aminotransferase [Anaerolineales bacterium]|nr:pyridoxal phosphate-dependent aminotransferase [Anaerolineales bacterium]